MLRMHVHSVGLRAGAGWVTPFVWFVCVLRPTCLPVWVTPAVRTGRGSHHPSSPHRCHPSGEWQGFSSSSTLRLNPSSAVDMLDRRRDGGTVVISSSGSIGDIMALSLVS